jgi:hypothetical protein
MVKSYTNLSVGMFLFHGKALAPNILNSRIYYNSIPIYLTSIRSAKVAASGPWSKKGSFGTERSLATIEERAFAKQLEEDQKAKLRYCAVTMKYSMMDSELYLENEIQEITLQAGKAGRSTSVGQSQASGRWQGS